MRLPSLKTLLALRRVFITLISGIDAYCLEVHGWRPKQSLDIGDRIEYKEREL